MLFLALIQAETLPSSIYRLRLTFRRKTLIVCGPEWGDRGLLPSTTADDPIQALLRRRHLANSAQARKRARQADKRRALNTSQRSEFRTYLKRVVMAIDAGEKDKAAELYKESVPMIDKTASKGLISANKAARHKSRLNSQIRAM